MRLSLALSCIIGVNFNGINSFTVPRNRAISFQSVAPFNVVTLRLSNKDGDDDDDIEEEGRVNPYQDPNYPEVSFIGFQKKSDLFVNLITNLLCQ